MLKVLIVDDEELIREGMRSFPWEKHGCEIAGLAEDGEEALLMARLLSPDIVISDIRMPGIDGLTLADRLKKEHPQISIILLTGFDEIEYVRQALHLQIDDYLLKPASIGDLEKSLDTVTKNLRIRQNRESRYQKLNHQISAALPVLRSSLFTQLANGHFNSEVEAAHSFGLFDIPTGSYVVISASYQAKTLENNSSDVRESWMFAMTISDACQELFSNYTSDTLVFHNNRCLYFLLVFSQGIKSADCMNAVQLATHKVKKKLKSDLDVDLSFGVSNMGRCLLDISDLYYQANSALIQCYFFNDNPTLFYSDIQEATPEDFHIPVAKREFFINTILTGNVRAMEQYVDFLLHPTSSNSFGDINQYKYRVISEVFYAVQLTSEKTFAEVLGTGKYEEFTIPILNCRSLEELKEVSLSLLNSIITGKRSTSASHYDSTAEKIIQYINEHYQENISLDLLAEQFHFSPTYISRLIRRSQGTTFTEIVSEARLSQAKRLLSDRTLRTADIGKIVGYRDTSYFIQSFKKRFGATPNEYRNLIEM